MNVSSYSSIASLRKRTPARTSPPHMSHAAVPNLAAAHDKTHLLPAHPSAIPVSPSSGPLESEADLAASRAVGRLAAPQPRPALSSQSVQTTQAVLGAFDSPGRALDPQTRADLAPHLGGNLHHVRIHTGAAAASAAQSVQAQACTIGGDIFFNEGRYNPHTGEGRRLLAHELAHTAQQSGGSPGLSSTPVALARDPIPKTAPSPTPDDKKPQVVVVPVPTPLMQRFQLTPPWVLARPKQPSLLSPDADPFAPGMPGSIYNQPQPIGRPGPMFLQPPSQWATPPSPLTGSQGSSASTPSAAPKAPDRLSLVEAGGISFGARIGFPTLDDTSSGDSPSALQESIKQGEILNFMVTGKPPSEYSVDPGKLVGALWGIFSTQIDPNLAKKIASGMAPKHTGSKVSYALDVTLLYSSDPKPGGGAGATLTVTFP